MKQIAYSDFGERLVQRSPDSRKPISGQWALTHNCNLACLHCYVVKDRNLKELNFNQIVDILDQIHQEGCLWLTFTGGEPFMRQDFLDIYTYAKNKGFLITLFTNGTLLNADMVNYLEKLPPFMIEITLHSVEKDIFDTITRVKGSFENCMQGIRLIREKKLPLTLKTVGMSLNRGQIHKIKEFVRGLENVEFKFDAFVAVRHDGSKQACQLRLSPDEVIEIGFNDKEIRREWYNCVKNKENFIESKRLFSCSAGLTSFYINPYGGLQLCLEMPRPVFDLRKYSFEEGFYNFLFNLRSGDYPLESPCRECEVYYLCGQCPARSLLENGEMEKPVEYLCQLAHKIAETINKENKSEEFTKTN
jgi:radical SAM protein with 4Fe4S-binding SPASM domain